MTERLLHEARRTANMDTPLQIYFQITARCQRVFWKYESMAYALILKNLGALYATMYLVATAMDLAPCALGGGDSELFAEIAGLDPSEEPAVGEFLLGSRMDS
jgi:SagB-type dehydrogenase family enzyme